MIEDWDSGYYARQMLCIPCWSARQADARKTPCRRCGMRVSEESGGSIRGAFYCGSCKREVEREIQTRTCFVCKKFIESWENVHQSPDGKPICDKCFGTKSGRSGAKICIRCGKALQKLVLRVGEPELCENCLALNESGKRQRGRFVSKLVAAFAVFAGS